MIVVVVAHIFTLLGNDEASFVRRTLQEILAHVRVVRKRLFLTFVRAVVLGWGTAKGAALRKARLVAFRSDGHAVEAQVVPS